LNFKNDSSSIYPTTIKEERVVQDKVLQFENMKKAEMDIVRLN
jgi:hypothetical protein